MASLSKFQSQAAPLPSAPRPRPATPVASEATAIPPAPRLPERDDPERTAPERGAIEAQMHELLKRARPQSSAEALWMLRQHYPQVSLTNRVAAIAAVLRF